MSPPPPGGGLRGVRAGTVASASAPGEPQQPALPGGGPARGGGGRRVPSPPGDAAAVGERYRPRCGDVAGVSLREHTLNERVAGKAGVFSPAGH